MMNIQTVDELAVRYNLKRNYDQNQIVFVKVNGDQHEWPAKIMNFFIQKQKNKQKNQEEKQDLYDPFEKVSRKKNKSNKKNQKVELVYKVRYFQWQYFTYVTDQHIFPYSLDIENKLIQIKDKKLQKALDKAKGQMTQSQKKKMTINQKCVKLEDQVKVDKKKRKKDKVQEKKLINVSKNAKLQMSEINEEKSQKQRETASQQKIPQLSFTLTNEFQLQQQPKIKFEYEQPIKRNLNNNESNELFYQTQIKQQYLLDNVLFKNKYQILGIFCDILEDFSTKVLWIDRKLESRQSQDLKRLKTLNKILDAEIFKLEDLTESKCLQKMLNIVRIGELVNIKQKYASGLQSDKNKFIIEVYKTYTKIVNGLKKIKNEFEKGQNSKSRQMNQNSRLLELQNTSIISQSSTKHEDKQNKTNKDISESLVIDYSSMMNIYFGI